MAISFVRSVTASVSGGTSAAPVLSGVAAGNKLVLASAIWQAGLGTAFPSGVTIRAKAPDGRVLLGLPVSGGQAGSFYADFEMDMAGTWFVRVACTGPTASATEGEVEVRASLVSA